MNTMFYGCSNLYRLDLTSFDTSKVQNTSFMFADCSYAVEILITGWNLSSVVDMSKMFAYDGALESIGRDPMSILNGNAEGLFEGCFQLFPDQL